MTHIKATFQVTRSHRSRQQLADAKFKRPARKARTPHITKLMALAIRLEHLLATGQVSGQAEIARAAGITRARVTQILNLTNLAPDIQEEIQPRALFLETALAMYPQRIYCLDMTKKKANPPLTPAVLYILLALSDQERHGYGIMKQVEADSKGKVKMGPGTLYGSIGRMIEAGLISESNKKINPRIDDERRVYYRITGLGQELIAAELERYRDVVAVAKLRHLSLSGLADGI